MWTDKGNNRKLDVINRNNGKNKLRAAGWLKFYDVIDALKASGAGNRAHPFNTTVLKAKGKTKAEENMLATTEKAMERRTLGVSLCEHTGKLSC